MLQGFIALCACGRRLNVRYAGKGGLYPIYECNWRSREALAPQDCMSLPSKTLDHAIAERLLTAVTPLTVKLALNKL
ncbi:recombinase zinc beta ribbon domain-containing protein [Bradyrhizobium sp. PMVTL-01]|uniref:recombinase zinc beta ribbon domain-containing protein n=1 Tax=Bradyrhizobium sp. PMVTL-01 TaxID=3434999 RepID=UPI003F725A45